MTRQQFCLALDELVSDARQFDLAIEDLLLDLEDQCEVLRGVLISRRIEQGNDDGRETNGA